MPDFHEVRLELGIDYGAQGGPMGNTRITEVSSGHEHRRILWAQDRGRWQLGERVVSQTDLNYLLAFFRTRRMRAYGFRFKDWSDYKIVNQSIGIGDANEDEFQIYKRYSSGGELYDRTIKKIVADTVTIFVDAVEQIENTDFTLDYDTGLITFSSAPGESDIITISCEFDVPVRFDTENFISRFDAYDDDSGEAHFYLSSLPIIEDRI